MWAATSRRALRRHVRAHSRPDMLRGVSAQTLSPGTAEDPRYLRVREALTDAILRLAATRRAEDIPVQELAREARISRQTFYGHAASPADLLTEILVEDLGPTNDQLLDPLEPGASDRPLLDIWTESFLATLAHIQRFADVYAVMVREHSTVYNQVLASMEATSHEFVRLTAGRMEGGEPDELWMEMAAQQQINNLSAAIQAWILTDMADPPEQVLATYLTLVPPWQLAHADESGRISLRGVRSPRRAGDL